MATQQVEAEISPFTAAADYSSNQYQAVALTAAATTVTLATVAGQRVLGPLQNKPTSGQAAVVQVSGVAKWKAGAAVAIGDHLVVDSTGRVVPCAATAGYFVGWCMEAAAAANEIASVLIEMAPRPVITHDVPMLLATIANGDLVTGYTPGFAGRIIGLEATVTAAATTASKLSTLNLEIGTTNLTGGSLALTSANMTPLGAIVAASAITAANTFTASDTISLEAASTTAFAEGSAVFTIKMLQD